jgi:hypothetical protein
MSDQTDPEVCDRCGRGRVKKRWLRIDFLQWSDRGVLRCHATVPVGVCDACNAKAWDETAESIVEEAIRNEYDKLRE